MKYVRVKHIKEVFRQHKAEDHNVSKALKAVKKEILGAVEEQKKRSSAYEGEIVKDLIGKGYCYKPDYDKSRLGLSRTIPREHGLKKMTVHLDLREGLLGIWIEKDKVMEWYNEELIPKELLEGDYVEEFNLWLNRQIEKCP